MQLTQIQTRNFLKPPSGQLKAQSIGLESLQLKPD